MLFIKFNLFGLSAQGKACSQTHFNIRINDLVKELNDLQIQEAAHNLVHREGSIDNYRLVLKC